MRNIEKTEREEYRFYLRWNISIGTYRLEHTRLDRNRNMEEISHTQHNSPSPYATNMTYVHYFNK